MIRVARVRVDSIGADLGIPVGTVLVRLNGADLRDSLDLQYLEAAERVELEVEKPDGERVIFEIEKEEFESIGLVPEADKIRRCTNACPFCFVKGNPKALKLRPSLYIKDDDYRLSFMYGHYVTLTNLREEDWQRIFEQRLSPLYVSVHATDPEVRGRMLVNPRSREINEHLDRLSEGGIAFHAQVVICPGINDGPALDRTIDDLYGRGETVLSLSVVPVGLTRFNQEAGIRPMSVDECRAILRRVEGARAIALRERGLGWCYASDELFIAAGHDAPGSEYFDNDELVGNGVGAISQLRDAVRADLDRLPRLEGRRIVLVTGVAMDPTLQTLAGDLAAACGAHVEVAAVPNSLYGALVTSAGLLSGEDHLGGLRPYEGFDLALFSRSAVNEDGVFLDDLSLEELRASLPGLAIRAADHVTDELVAWS